jgi:hypothetical protein
MQAENFRRGGDVADLAERLTGTCHLPDDPAYKSCCAIWNGMIDKRPALVLRPASAADISAAIASSPGIITCRSGCAVVGTTWRAQP